MPRSRSRKKRGAGKADPPGKVSFSTFSLGEGNHDAFKLAMIQAARDRVEEFPELVATLLGVFRDRAPDSVLATFSFYGSRAMIGKDGSTRTLTKDVLQHHIELLQSLVLTLPAEEWGIGPPTAEIMQVVFDSVPRLSDAFVQIRISEHEDEPDLQLRAVSLLQEKIRLHTQAVRNWGYYGDVIRISRELYMPLDEKFKRAVGYSPTDLIDIAEFLVSEVERRSGEHMKFLRRVLRGKTTTELAHLYFRYAPDLTGKAEDVLQIIPPETPRATMIAFILSHSDLRHLEIMSFSASEVAQNTGKPLPLVETVLDALSLRPGELAAANVRHLFLANPVWSKPGVKLPDSYLFAIPQAIFSHINEIMRVMAAAAKIEDALSSRRAAYLEGKMVDTLQAALPSARITQNVKWTLGDRQFETDAIAVVDRTLIIAEAKSHRITPQALRGAPERLKHHIVDLVINPSIQSERLEGLVYDARSGNTEAKQIVTSLGIDALSIDQVIRISVSLDDLSIISSSEDELSDIQLIPAGHKLAPSLHIADLICISDIIDHELLFIHYFFERFHFQKQFNLFGDELDFLGLYLATGFNLGPDRDDFRRMMISGMSSPIDRYYDGRDAGLKLSKPKANLRPVYRSLIDRLALTKPPGWSTIGIILLNSASCEEQVEIERGLVRLRKSVSRKFKKPNDDCFMAIVPALDRKATVGFYVFPESEADRRHGRMEHFAAEALEREGAQACVIFGKNADRWTEPYATVLMARAV